LSGPEGAAALAKNPINGKTPKLRSNPCFMVAVPRSLNKHVSGTERES
jgi:hypothetical protein